MAVAGTDTNSGEWKLPWDGGCRCGALRFRISAPPLLASVCRCRGCQKMTASAFSTSLSVPSDGFAVTEGEAAIGGLHLDQAHHQHCDFCKSWVFSSFEPDLGFVNVRATMLDDAGWFVPFVAMYTDEMLPWARTPAPRSYPRFPEMSEYAELAAAYAREGARPPAIPRPI